MISYRLILFFSVAVLFLTTVNAKGQFNSRSPFGESSNITSNINRVKSVVFYDSAGKSLKGFKKITIHYYAFFDTLISHKKQKEKCIVKFNKNGQISFITKYDSVNVLTDSIVLLYDSKSNQNKEISFSKDDSTRKMLMEYAEYLFRDNKGRVLTDSTISVDNDELTREGKGITHAVIYHEYDNAGNQIKLLTKKENDTSELVISEFDSKRREIMHKVYNSDYRWDSKSKTLDDSSNIIKETTIGSGGDTTVENSAYNTNNEWILYSKYVNRVNTYRSTRNLKSDGSGTITSDYFSGDKDDGTCGQTNHAIDVYNNKKLPLSSVDNSFRNGKPLNTTTLHIYEFTLDGKVLKDSEIIKEESQWQSCKTTEVVEKRYDKNGNTIYDKTIGGSQYSSNSETRTTFNDKNSILTEEFYNNCSDKPTQKSFSTYYPDGKTLKETIENRGKATKTIKCGKDGRMLEEIVYSDNDLRERFYYPGSYQIIAEYEEYK